MKKWLLSAIPLVILLVLLFTFEWFDTKKLTSENELPRVELNIYEKLDPEYKNVYSKADISVTDYENKAYNMERIKTDVRLRGNGTLRLPKSSYKLVFDNEINLLGTGNVASKEWALLGQYGDTSSVQSYLAYSFADKLDGLEWTPDNRLVDLWVNGEYVGVYLVIELIETGVDKVNIESGPGSGENIGYLLKMTSYDVDSDYIELKDINYEIISELSTNEDLKARQLEYIRTLLIEGYEALLSGDYDRIDSRIDIDSLVDYYLLHEYVMDYDVGWDSFYIYRKNNGKIYFGPGWDFDLTFGLDWTGGEPDKIFAGAKVDRGSKSNYWFCAALDCEWFRIMVRDRYNEIAESREAMLIELGTITEKYKVSFLHEWDRWGKREDSFSYMFLGDYESYEERVGILCNWITVRDQYLDNLYNSEAFIVKGLTEDDYVSKR